MWAGVGVSLILVGVVFCLFSNAYIFLQERRSKSKETAKFSFHKLKLWERNKGDVNEEIIVTPIVLLQQRNVRIFFTKSLTVKIFHFRNQKK